MPSGTHFPSGEIHVTNQNLQDISGGMRWNMQHADNVRFLAVSGTMTIGTIRATYDFTLVVYEMHIDEVAWTIFSTLADALTEEFTDQFWQIVNHRRKDRRGFLDVPWIEAQQAYDVNAAYRAVRLSVFNNQGHTVRVTSPFIWNDTYLKVHPNGAAVFAEDKKFEFLLPWIITSHGLLPPNRSFGSQMREPFPSIGRRYGCMKTPSDGCLIQARLIHRSYTMRFSHACKGCRIIHRLHQKEGLRFPSRDAGKNALPEIQTHKHCQPPHPRNRKHHNHRNPRHRN